MHVPASDQCCCEALQIHYLMLKRSYRSCQSFKKGNRKVVYITGDDRHSAYLPTEASQQQAGPCLPGINALSYYTITK